MNTWSFGGRGRAQVGLDNSPSGAWPGETINMKGAPGSVVGGLVALAPLHVCLPRSEPLRVVGGRGRAGATLVTLVSGSSPG